MEERLSKALAWAGVASRREADALIAEGRVSVNGEVIREPAHRVLLDEDHIKVDGKLLASSGPPIYLALNKPKGVLTSRKDPEGRPTVVSLLRGFKGRLLPVGRLEREDEGLLLVTNDSALAAGLNRPELGMTQILLIKVRGLPDERTLVKMRTGVPLEKGRTRPMEVTVISSTARNTWLRVVTRESRSQMLEFMLAKLRHPLMKVKRQSMGPIGIAGLAPGTYRALTEAELKALRDTVENPPGLPPVQHLDEAELDALVLEAQQLRERQAAARREGPRPRKKAPSKGERPRGERPAAGAPRHLKPGQDEGVGRFSRAGVARARKPSRTAR